MSPTGSARKPRSSGSRGSNKPSTGRPQKSQAEIDAWRAEREEKLDHARQLLEDGVENLRTSQDWLEATAIASKMHNYSFNNCLRIWLQKPDATLVASRSRWKRLGFDVLEGATPIIVEAVYNKRSSGRVDKTGGSNVAEREQDDERPSEKADADAPEQKRYRNNSKGLKAEETFDISQTTAKDIKFAVPELLTGDAPEELRTLLIEDLSTTYGYTVKVVPRSLLGSAHGAAKPDKSEVWLADDLEPAASLKTLAHEHGHIAFDHVSDLVEYQEHRGTAEAAAEAYAHLMLNLAGLDTDAYSLAYIATWAEREPTMRKSITTAANAASVKVNEVLDRLPGIMRDPFKRLEAAKLEADDATFQRGANEQFIRALSTAPNTADIVISHSAAEGTLVLGKTKEHKEIIKSTPGIGFNFSTALGPEKKVGWYVPASRGEPPKKLAIATLTENLAKAGARVAVILEDERTQHRATGSEKSSAPNRPPRLRTATPKEPEPKRVDRNPEAKRVDRSAQLKPTEKAAPPGKGDQMVLGF